MISSFYVIECIGEKPRVNAGKNKVVVFERKEVEVVKIGNPYRVRVPVDKRCEIVIGGEKMEVVKELKCLGMALSKHGEIGEVRERAVKDRSVVGSLARVVEGRNVSMEVKRSLTCKMFSTYIYVWAIKCLICIYMEPFFPSLLAFRTLKMVHYISFMPKYDFDSSILFLLSCCGPFIERIIDCE